MRADSVDAKARHRLVEQQQLRFGRERDGKLELALLAMAQIAKPRHRRVPEPDPVERRLRRLAEVAFLAGIAPEAERVTVMGLRRQRDIVDAVKSGSSEVIWNERARPSALRRQAGTRVMSRPAKRMVPAMRRSCPVNWLISVVLPAPFGPMIACNSPFATSSERWSVAMMPPNRWTSFSTRSSGSATAKTSRAGP